MPYKRKYEVSAGAVVIHPSGKKILLVHSIMGAGGWGFPKGHIMAEEQPLDCAIREVAEETGLQGDKLSPVGALKTVRQIIRYKKSQELVTKETFFYLLMSSSDKISEHPNDGHHDRASWISWNRLSDLRHRYKYVPVLAKEAHNLAKCEKL